MSHLTHANFQQRLHTSFHLQLEGDAPVDLVLTEVSDLKTTPRQEIFSIYFRGPAEFVLPQSIYRLAHATLESCELFLVPISRDSAGVMYEAVFNRLLPSSASK